MKIVIIPYEDISICISQSCARHIYLCWKVAIWIMNCVTLLICFEIYYKLKSPTIMKKLTMFNTLIFPYSTIIIMEAKLRSDLYHVNMFLLMMGRKL